MGLLERLLGNQKLSLDLGNQNFGICNQGQFFLQMSFIASYSSSYTWSIFLSGKYCLKKLQSIRSIVEKSFHEVKVEKFGRNFLLLHFFFFFFSFNVLSENFCRSWVNLVIRLENLKWSFHIVRRELFIDVTFQSWWLIELL